MKIGQFANKHGVTHDTVRFYIDKGLLVPNKKEGQYSFSDVDSKEIEKIIELKQMYFSLAEIHRILTFQRLGGANTEFSRKLFLMILEEKQKHVNHELTKLNVIHNYLTKQIEEITSVSHNHEQLLGFPITSIELLECPSCKKDLNLSAGVIEKNMIIHAEIECECGFKASIKDGIYIDEKAVRHKLVNGKPIPTKEEYLMNTSHSYISYLFKGMAKLIDFTIKYQKGSQYIMELNNCVGFFLLQYIDYLPKDSVYILIDYDIDRMTQLKKNLECYYSHKKFIFLCCDYINLPIKRSTVDIVVDLFMSDVYERENNENLINIITPFLKDNGIYAGSYPYCKMHTSAGETIEVKEKECVHKESIRKRISASDIKILESIAIGPAYHESSKHQRGKHRREYQYVYVGKKELKARC